MKEMAKIFIIPHRTSCPGIYISLHITFIPLIAINIFTPIINNIYVISSASKNYLIQKHASTNLFYTKSIIYAYYSCNGKGPNVS